jgi:hypothetical protein
MYGTVTTDWAGSGGKDSPRSYGMKMYAAVIFRLK